MYGINAFIRSFWGNGKSSSCNVCFLVLSFRFMLGSVHCVWSVASVWPYSANSDQYSSCYLHSVLSTAQFRCKSYHLLFVLHKNLQEPSVSLLFMNGHCFLQRQLLNRSWGLATIFFWREQKKKSYWYIFLYAQFVSHFFAAGVTSLSKNSAEFVDGPYRFSSLFFISYWFIDFTVGFPNTTSAKISSWTFIQNICLQKLYWSLSIFISVSYVIYFWYRLHCNYLYIL